MPGISNDIAPTPNYLKEGATVLRAALIIIPAFMLMVPTQADAAQSKHEELIVKMIGLMNQVCDQIEKAEGQEEMEAAMKGMQAQMEALQKEAEALGKPSPEEEQKLKEKYEDQMKKVMQRLMMLMMQKGGQGMPGMQPESTPAP